MRAKKEFPKIRVAASVDPRLKAEVWDLLENKSAFVEICLQEAVNILEWHLLKKSDPKSYYDTSEKTVDGLAEEFNRLHRNDKPNLAKKGLIKKVDGKWIETTSQSPVDSWL